MNMEFMSALFLFCFGVILLTGPMQLFERNYPDVVMYIRKNKNFMTILKVNGFLFIVVSIILILKSFV